MLYLAFALAIISSYDLIEKVMKKIEAE